MDCWILQDEEVEYYIILLLRILYFIRASILQLTEQFLRKFYFELYMQILTRALPLHNEGNPVQ